MRFISARKQVAAILSAGILLRLIAAWLFQSAPASAGGDDAQYLSLANHLAAGEGFLMEGIPSAFRAPLYPLWLSVWVGFGLGLAQLRFIAGLWSGLGIWLAWRIGEELEPPGAGRAAAAFLAFHPEQILLPTSLYLESFYGVLVLGVAWALARWRRDPSPKSAACFGALVGLSLAARSTLALLVPIAVLWRAWELKQWRAWSREAGMMALMALLPLIPWLYRNYAQFGRVIPFESGVAGPVIWYASAGWDIAPSDEGRVEPMRTMYEKLPHTEYDSFAFPRAARNIASSPLAYLWGCMRRVWYLWSDSYFPYLLRAHPSLTGKIENHGRWELLAWSDRLVRLLLIALAVAGLYRRRSAPVFMIAGLALYFNVYALGAVFIRFMAPVAPLLCVLAGVGLVEAIRALGPNPNKGSV